MMIRRYLPFFRWNLQHYVLAVWGLRLRFDPPYLQVHRPLSQDVAEPVFEYRGYGLLHGLWALLLAWGLPLPLGWFLVTVWALQSVHRSHYLQSNLVFWRQVVRENGVKITRAHGRYMECLIREMERRMKAGEDWQECSTEALRLQNEVIRVAGGKDAAKRILAGS